MEKQKFVLRLILLVLIAGTISCRSRENKGAAAAVNQEPSVIEASIGGMFCTDCEQTIQKKVGELEGDKIGKGIVYCRQCDY